MATRRKSIFNLLQERVALLERSDDVFLDEIKRTENTLFQRIKKLLAGLTIQSGFIVNDESASNLLLSLRRRILNVLQKSNLSTKVDDFLPRFDQVNKLEDEVYGRLITNFSLPDTRVAKRIAIETVVNSLKESRGLNVNYVDPLVRRMWQLIESQVRFSEAERVLRNYIKGETPSGGELAKYARQVTLDLLNGYHGFVQQKIQERYDLDGWYYIGSIIETSRPNCVHLVNGDGWFEDLAIRPGLYRTADIPEVVRRARRPSHYGGWRPETTPETFPIHRCGFQCRHSLLFVALTEEEQVEKIGRAQRELKKFREIGSVFLPPTP